jgi:serine/threonine-protein kinase
MELLRGRTLEQELDRGPIDGALAAFIGVQICEGLSAAHTAGVVHRDLKPANIYLADDEDGAWSVKLLDFGISKILSDHAFAVKITLDGSIIGTPHYMAPEQVSGWPDVDARADLYAVGVLLYEAVGGQPAFEASSFGALAVKIKEGKPLPLAALAPELDPALRQVIERAMHRDRDARPATAAELRTALLPFARWRPLAERNGSPSPEPGGPG